MALPITPTDGVRAMGPASSAVITKTYLPEAGHRVDARLTRERILAVLIWALIAVSWTVALMTIAGTWNPMSAPILSASMIVSAALCIVLWKVLSNRQTFLLAISLAGTASFLGSYLIMFLILGISL